MRLVWILSSFLLLSEVWARNEDLACWGSLAAIEVNGPKPSPSASEFVEALVDQVVIPAFRQFHIEESHLRGLFEDPLQAPLLNLEGIHVGSLGVLWKQVQENLKSRGDEFQSFFISYFKQRLAEYVAELGTQKETSEEIIRSKTELEAIRLISLGSKGFSMKLSFDGRLLGWAGDDGRVVIMDALRFTKLQDFSAPSDLLWALAWNSDSSMVAVGGCDGVIAIADPTSGRIIKVLQRDDQVVSSLVWIPETSHLIVGSYNGLIRIWDVDSDRILRTFRGSATSILALALNPRTNQLISLDMSRKYSLRQLNPRSSLRVLPELSAKARSLAVSPRGDRFISTAHDGSMAIYALPSGRRVHLSQMKHRKFVDVAFDSSGQRFATCDSRGRVEVRGLMDAKTRQEYMMSMAGEGVVVWSSDSRYLFGTNDEGAIRRWSVPYPDAQP